MKKILIIVIIALLSAFFVYKMVTYKEKPFAKISLTSNNTIYNITDKKYLDTIVNLALDRVKVKGTIVVIKPLSNLMKNALIKDDRKLVAHVIGNNNSYVIFIDSNNNRNTFIEVLSHECWHVKQYQTKRLIANLKEPGVVLFNKVKYNTSNTPYIERPWEVEAFEKQSDIKNYILETLIKKVKYFITKDFR